MTGHNGGDVILVRCIFSDESREAAFESDFKLNKTLDCLLPCAG